MSKQSLNFQFWVTYPFSTRNVSECDHYPLSPFILTQTLLHLSNVLEFVQEPLVYGSQVMDLINGHATVQGLKKQNNPHNA